jgi:hypothetical protein
VKRPTPDQILVALRPLAVGGSNGTKFRLGSSVYDWPQASKLVELSLLTETRPTDYITTDLALGMARRLADLEETMASLQRALDPNQRRRGW